MQSTGPPAQRVRNVAAHAGGAILARGAQASVRCPRCERMRNPLGRTAGRSTGTASSHGTGGRLRETTARETVAGRDHERGAPIPRSRPSRRTGPVNLTRQAHVAHEPASLVASWQPPDPGRPPCNAALRQRGLPYSSLGLRTTGVKRPPDSADARRGHARRDSGRHSERETILSRRISTLSAGFPLNTRAALLTRTCGRRQGNVSDRDAGSLQRCCCKHRAQHNSVPPVDSACNAAYCH